MCITKARLTAGAHCVMCLVLALTSYSGEGTPKRDTTNGTVVHSPTKENLLHDLSDFWSYNETLDISKYEEFDHNKIIGISGLSFDNSAPNAGGPLWTDSGSDTDSLSQHELPVFDISLVTNVSVQLGGNAFLHCRVKNANDLRVSWVRRRDWHIISSGSMTYTNDERFQVVHTENTDDWDLQIKFVQKRDNGTYECQVATSIGVISHYYNLHVVIPAAFILGSGDYHIGQGSTISLVCIIENSPSPPQYVFWYHNDKMVNYDSVRGGVTVNTEPGPKTHSRLIVNKATPADSGNYTCKAPNTEPDTIHVFVSKEGENTAAIQRHDSACSHKLSLVFPLMLSTVIVKSL